MGAEVSWIVVYEVPTEEKDVFYGVTSEEAMQVVIDNGPPGAKPLYAYRKDFPDVKYNWPWGSR